MKRFITTITMAIAITFTAAAQKSDVNYNNFYSMRLGINFASLISDDYTSDSQSGFNAAALYNISLMDEIPLYLQSGVGVTMKGARNSGLLSTSSTTHFKSYAVTIPVTLTYDLAINNSLSVVPEFGLFYSYAFAGSLEGDDAFFRPYKDLDVVTPAEDVISTKLFHRSDFGIRAGISLRKGAYLAGFAYEAGLVNTFSKDLRNAGVESNTGCWSVNLGYRFN